MKAAILKDHTAQDHYPSFQMDLTAPINGNRAYSHQHREDLLSIGSPQPSYQKSCLAGSFATQPGDEIWTQSNSIGKSPRSWSSHTFGLHAPNYPGCEHILHEFPGDPHSGYPYAAKPPFESCCNSYDPSQHIYCEKPHLDLMGSKTECLGIGTTSSPPWRLWNDSWSAPSHKHVPHRDLSRFSPNRKVTSTSPRDVESWNPSIDEPKSFCGIFDGRTSYKIKHAYRKPSSLVQELSYSPCLLSDFHQDEQSSMRELKSIKGHLLDVARDQTGSRFIQLRLEFASSDERNAVFEEALPQALVLMTDVFGNYVIQKLFELGTTHQQQQLIASMKSSMVELALQVYGCRVIQKALEVVNVYEKVTILRELIGHTMRCIIDQNGNHVIQKCIEVCSYKNPANTESKQLRGTDVQFIIDAFMGKAAKLSTHAYGCRVIQRILEHCELEQTLPLVDELIWKCRELVKNQFGNYVVQHVIMHGADNHRAMIESILLEELPYWSMHKYASNVVETYLEHTDADKICLAIDSILAPDESGVPRTLLTMMKHMYGNYVVQKLLDKADRTSHARILGIIKENSAFLEKFTYGRHVLGRLKRLEGRQ
uniref:Pumiliolike mating protein M90 putative n=1 Tax=Albugo laibachii Nc14 TaxID=890382 RepID=F0WTP1_9STRA|nr:pumiliolike mating protein M90 putative [Albugo laibachii Nc14]|eukprot:CCA24733.1 pumiliolike mating protein M90 putative [Albugo laibachii Nc14]